MTVADAPVEIPAEPPKGSRRRPGFLGAAGWYPLVILFGLNLVDELDRSAYLILLPEIRDDLGLNNQGILSVVAIAAAVALLLTVPIAHMADRSQPRAHRVGRRRACGRASRSAPALPSASGCWC